MSEGGSHNEGADEPSSNPAWDANAQFYCDKLMDTFKKKQAELEYESQLLEKRKQDLEREYSEKFQELANEKLQMQQVHQLQVEKVKLDVGGQPYSTSKQTLCRYPDSMLGIMFSGRHPLHQSEDGSYFIDRDGFYFRYLLNFLRGSITALKDLPTDRDLLWDLRREADYFQLVPLLQLLDDALVVPAVDTDYSQQHIDTMLSNMFLSVQNQQQDTAVSLPSATAAPASSSAPMNIPHSNLEASFDESIPVNCEQREEGNIAAAQKVTRCALDFSSKNLKGISFSHTSFLHDVSFKMTSLVGANFYGCEFSSMARINFQGSDIAGADFRQCKGKQFSCVGGANGDMRSGLMSGSSSNSLLTLIQEGRVNFRNSNWVQALFDQNVWNCLQKNCPSFKVLPMNRTSMSP